MKLPLLVSVPHAGVCVPPEVASICQLSLEDIIADSDVGAREVYNFPDQVTAFLTTDIARAIIDLNRKPNDFRPDGVIKTHTCWNVPVYSEFPSPSLQTELLEKYYFPYHRRLEELAVPGILLGIDCHTMADFGPPTSPDRGLKRPLVCLSDAAGGTCPRKWRDFMARFLIEEFGQDVFLNKPFRGGFIIRSHSMKLPWLQLEISRLRDLSNVEKKERLLAALKKWCVAVGNSMP